MVFIYVVSGWLLFHWLCYGILAHRLIVSDRYRRYGWLRMTIYAGAGPFVSTVIIIVGLLRVGGIALMIVGAAVLLVSCWIWADKFADPAFKGDVGFSSGRMPPPSTAIALPLLGPLFALLWVGLSIGLDELIGVGRGDRADRREYIIGRIMVGAVIVFTVSYITHAIFSK